MFQQATITSKMQVTLPIKLARKVGLKSGQKIQVKEENGRLILTPMRQLVEELAGSWSLPKKWKGKDIDEIIEEAKEEHFKNKYASKKT